MSIPLKESVGPEFVAFRGVVVDDVLDNLDARTVVLRDHFLEFVDVRPGEVSGLRREKAYRVISPVVAAAFLYEIVVIDERMGREGALPKLIPRLAYVIHDFVMHQIRQRSPDQLQEPLGGAS